MSRQQQVRQQGRTVKRETESTHSPATDDRVQKATATRNEIAAILDGVLNDDQSDSRIGLERQAQPLRSRQQADAEFVELFKRQNQSGQ